MSTRSSVGGFAGEKVLFAVFVLFCTGVAAFFLRDIFKPQAADKSGAVQTAAERNNAINVEKLPVGWLTVQDPWGNQVSRFRTLIINNSWVAVPARGCVGGSTILFQADGGKEEKIDSGLWTEKSSLMLWHIEEKKILAESPTLASWRQGEPLQWLSLSPGAQPKAVNIPVLRRKNIFFHAELPPAMNEPGIFIQNRNVVGWTFGKWEKGAFLWTERAWDELGNASTWLNEFYEKTFANGREEQFLRALAMGNEVSVYSRLSALVKGLQFDPKLPKEDTPVHLRSDAILVKIHSLATEVLRKGRYNDILDLFRNPFLMEIIYEGKTVEEVIRKIVGSHGYRSGILLTEAAESGLQQIAIDKGDGLDGLYINLYREWLQEFVNKKNADSGLRIFYEASKRYPDEPEIQLLGAELSLLAGNWQYAEDIINAIDFPSALKWKVNDLLARIEALKPKASAEKAEGRIIINFPPGHTPIPVTARLNGVADQSFLIDTGATLVTVPSASVDSLGIVITSDTPRRNVSTAGGLITAWEVKLASIELDGWVEYDVKALVLDIPDQPGLGLLGLNFLNRFQMELNAEKGSLELTPQQRREEPGY